MQTVTTIGLDIAKSVFQVHGIDAEGGAQKPPLPARVNSHCARDVNPQLWEPAPFPPPELTHQG